MNVDEPLDAGGTDSRPLEHVKSTLEEVERRHITRTLEEVNGKISGEGGAAEVLGMNPSTLRARMRKLRKLSDSARPESIGRKLTVIGSPAHLIRQMWQVSSNVTDDIRQIR